MRSEAVARAGAEPLERLRDGLSVQSLTPGGTPPEFRALRLVLNPVDADHTLGTHDRPEWVHVLDGTLRLVLESAEWKLGPGDSAYFDARLPHRLSCADDRPVEVLMVGWRPEGNAG